MPIKDYGVLKGKVSQRILATKKSEHYQILELTGKGAQLSNKGGIITLLNKEGLKIDGVTYTQKDASKEGVLVEL